MDKCSKEIRGDCGWRARMQLAGEYIKKEDFQMKEPQKNQEKGIRTRIVRESERGVYILVQEHRPQARL